LDHWKGGFTPVVSELQLYESERELLTVGLERVNFPAALGTPVGILEGVQDGDGFTVIAVGVAVV
jgi:hypothetical protein